MNTEVIDELEVHCDESPLHKI